jgi:hypothetical protein
LWEELGIEPEAETTTLYHQIRTATTTSPALPTSATPFLGRETELADIRAALADPNCRLLSLVGPGGIGKTRLALQAAGEQAHYFLHGVSWVALASIHAPELLDLFARPRTFTGAG